MTRHLDEDEKGTRLVRTPGGEQDAARHHSCAFCPSPILASAEDLRWAGWRRRGSYWVCPDCIGDQA